MASTHSIGKKFGKHINVVGTTDYKESVLAALKEINSWKVGQAVLGELTKMVTIVATGKPNDTHSSPRVATAAVPSGQQMFSCKDGDVRPGNIGTGGGTNTDIAFTPSHWKFPDMVLLHELVHSVQQTNGTLTCGKARDGFDTKAEVVSIVITNTYRSERGFQLYRRDHSDFTWIGKVEAYGLAAVNYVTLVKLTFDHARMCNKIAALTCDYNPIRDVDDLDQYRFRTKTAPGSARQQRQKKRYDRQVERHHRRSERREARKARRA